MEITLSLYEVVNFGNGFSYKHGWPETKAEEDARIPGSTLPETCLAVEAIIPSVFLPEACG